MDEHEPFIAAIEAQPDDRTARLVYADWLDERAHPAGEYLRAELHLASLPDGSAAAPDLRAKLRTLRPRIEPEWLARFDQPRVMLANPTPFPAGWWCFELPGVRNSGPTYSRIAYDALPPLHYPRFTGTFDWIPRSPRQPDLTPYHSASAEGLKAHFDRLIRHLTDLGLTVPRDFVNWMSDPSIGDYSSITGSYPFCLRDAARIEDPPGSRLVDIFEDELAGRRWSLYLTPEGSHAVVSGGVFLCSEWSSPGQRVPSPDEPLDTTVAPEQVADLNFVAPSVEVFLYRRALECSLWHKLRQQHEEAPVTLTPEEQAYIDFYRRHPGGGT
jgi:uncharacterized protein (TIGR02996 family)